MSNKSVNKQAKDDITLSKKVKKKLSKLNLQRQKEQNKIDKVR